MAWGRGEVRAIFASAMAGRAKGYSSPPWGQGGLLCGVSSFFLAPVAKVIGASLTPNIFRAHPHIHYPPSNSIPKAIGASFNSTLTETVRPPSRTRPRRLCRPSPYLNLTLAIQPRHSQCISTIPILSYLAFVYYQPTNLLAVQRRFHS